MPEESKYVKVYIALKDTDTPAADFEAIVNDGCSACGYAASEISIKEDSIGADYAFLLEKNE